VLNRKNIPHAEEPAQHASRSTRLAKRLIIALALTAVGFVVATSYTHSLGPAPTGEHLAYSTIVQDRNGRLLRPYATPDGKWRLPVTLDAVDPRFVKALVAYEDKRFYSHPGVDPLALARGAVQLLTNGKIVSGGSTLTMQVARLLEPRSERSMRAKLRQIVRAVQLERTLSKDEILTLYLNLAPYGGNLEGLRAATLAYFGKETRRLSLGEIALLVALPQSPEARRPDRGTERARAARDRVLNRIVATNGVIERQEIAQAQAEPVPDTRRPMPTLAAHAADAAIAAAPERKQHTLTIEAPLQRSLEELARDRARSFGPDMSVAIVAVDHATGEVVARVASSDYFDISRFGQVDMSHALRSPGSTLKPFIYGLGFEDGLIHPETQIEDRPTRYGSYAPENFDLTFQGTVTIRKALQMSLNVPAVAVLEAVGPNRLTARLTQAGGALVLPTGEAPGLAMGLGGVGVRLTDLTMLYAGIARGGMTMPLVERLDDAKDRAERRLLDAAAAWHLGNVLIGTPPPENAPRGQIAFKTGTSYGYRDAWAVGFDGKRTVGVWVGRPDGAPSPGLLGRTAAAPILFDALARMGRSPAPLPPRPPGVLVAATGKLPLPLQSFRPPGSTDPAQSGPRIVFPPNGARIEASGAGGTDQVPLKVAGGSGPLTVLVNGAPLPQKNSRRGYFWQPDGPGFARLTVMDIAGRSNSILVRVQ
jgi:penicillin-binding protein 1C